jgi:hypothetical protein
MADQVAASGPDTSVDPKAASRLTAAGRVVRWIATVFAAVGLLGLAIPPLRNVPPGPSGVRNLTVVSAVSLGALAIAAMLAGDRSSSGGAGGFWRGFGAALAIVCALFGLFIMTVFFIDRTDIWGDFLRVPSFSIGVVLLVLGIAIPLSISKRESRVVAGQIGALLVFSLSGVLFLGYVHGDPASGRLFLRPAISFQAAFISVVTAVGVLLIRPSRGLLSTASSPGAGGRLLRWLGPVVLLMPAILLLLAESVPSRERVDVLAFISVGLGLFLLILLSIFMKTLDETAIEAATMAAAAERATIGLEQEAPIVTRMAEVLHIVDVEDTAKWEVVTRFRPGRGTVTGDASAVRTLPNGGLGVVLVDLTGHGANPAVWAIRTRDLLLHSLVVGQSPSQAMSLVQWSAPGDFLASAIVIRVDPERGAVQLCSAGHPPAVLLRTGEALLQQPTGPLLYLDPDSTYGEHSFELSEGDTLVAYSDGVADVQVSRSGQTEPERLADVLLEEQGSAAFVAEVVLGFARTEQTDDQTVVVLHHLAGG